MPFSGAETYPFLGAKSRAAGVYGIVDIEGRVIYVGETDDLDRRIRQHQLDVDHKMHRLGPTFVWFEAVPNPFLRFSREQSLIAEYEPPANG